MAVSLPSRDGVPGLRHGKGARDVRVDLPVAFVNRQSRNVTENLMERQQPGRVEARTSMRRLDQRSGDLLEALEIDAGCVDGGEWQAVDGDEVENRLAAANRSVGSVQLSQNPLRCSQCSAWNSRISYSLRSACQGGTMSAQSAARANTQRDHEACVVFALVAVPTYLNGTTTSACQVSPADAHWRGCRHCFRSNRREQARPLLP